MSENTCEIRIYDPDFNWVGVATGAESVQFSRELYGVGSFEIHIHPDKPGAGDLARKNNIIVINGDGRKSGFIRDFQLEENKDSRRYTIYGLTGQGFAGQRITVPPNETQVAGALGWDKINADAETVLKHYAGRNLANAYDEKRNISRLVLAANGNRGKAFPWKSRYQRLSEEFQSIGEYAEMGYEIYADIANRQWVFDIIEGADRTKMNTSGNDPVLFNMKYQNLDSYRYAEDFRNYRNAGYCGGSGEDEKRLIYILGADNTGIDRYEEFLDCGNAENITELQYYGRQKMTDYEPVKNLEATALPRVFLFDQDYFLGDLVTVSMPTMGLEIGSRVTAVREVWEHAAGYSVDLRFGAKVPNVFNLLRKKEEVR